MSTRMLSLYAVFCALATTTTVSAQLFAPNPFTDVPENSPYFEAIEHLRTNNVLKGYEDGTFRPDARVNRAEFVKLIANPYILNTERLNECLNQELEEDETTVFFPDVRRDSWYAREVCLAKTAQLIDGYPDGTYRPGAYISFVEAAKILGNTFVMQTNPEPGDDRWFMPYVNKLSEQRAIPTSIRHFDQTLTRGEMAEMLFRLKTNTTNRPSRTATQIN